MGLKRDDLPAIEIVDQAEGREIPRETGVVASGSRRGLVWLVVCVAVLGVGAVGAVVVNDLGSDEPEESAPTSTPTTTRATTQPDRAGNGPATDPQIDVSSGAVDDGGLITVVGRGFSAHVEVVVHQCVDATDACDGGRGAYTTTDSDGTFGLEMRVFTEILGFEGWQVCEPCSLVATDGPTTSARHKLSVATNEPPIRPSVVIHPAGPFTSGQLITVRGTGFQTSANAVTIGWCQFRSDDPTSEISGDPAFGYAECGYPGAAFSAIPDSHDGSFEARFPMPSEDLAERCAETGTICGLADHPGEAMPPLFVTLFEMTT